MLEKLKILLGIADEDESKDEILMILISMCKAEAVDFCNLSEYTAKLDSAVLNMVIERYNKVGTEGLNSVSTHGITENYMDDYSPNVQKQLIKHRKIRLV